MANELTMVAVGDIEVRPTGQVMESRGWDADEQFDLVHPILAGADITQPEADDDAHPRRRRGRGEDGLAGIGQASIAVLGSIQQR